jgi:hypothetical protein
MPRERETERQRDRHTPIVLSSETMICIFVCVHHLVCREVLVYMFEVEGVVEHSSSVW